MSERCEFVHPHPEHPCGRRVIPGVTRCTHCGNLDDSPECGCWTRMTIPDFKGWMAEEGLDTTLSDSGPFSPVSVDE